MRLNWKWISALLLMVGLLHYGVLVYGFSSWADESSDAKTEDVMEARAISIAAPPPPPPPPEPVPPAKIKSITKPAPKTATKPSPPPTEQTGEAQPVGEGGDSAAQNSASAEASPPAVEIPPPEPPRPPVLPNKAPSSSLLEYFVEATVKGITYKGYGDLSWVSSAAEYKAHLRFYLDFGLFETEFVRWMSEGRFDEYGLAPRRFAEKRIKKSERAAHFLPDQNKITFSNNSPDAPLGAGTQDRMSVIIQLVALAAGAPNELIPGKRFNLVSVGASEASDLSARVAGNESVSTSFGEVAAVKIIANASGKYEDDLEVWLAPQYQYLPIKMRIIRTNGDVAEMTLHKKPKAI